MRDVSAVDGTSCVALAVRARTYDLERLSKRHTGIPIFPFGERLTDRVEVVKTAW